MADSEPWVHETTVVDGLDFHYVTAGEGPLVVLLHGFPEFWYSWREQIPALAAAGYRVVAPDMRGYNRTAGPADRAGYHVDRLVADVAELVDALGEDSAHLVGHDWGGFVGWEAAMTRPALIDSFVSLGVTHPAAFESGLDRVGQLANAWYMYFFRLPRLPEWALARDDHAFHEGMVRDQVAVEDAFDEADFQRYREAMARPGALTAMLNYYRANTGRRLGRKLLAPRFGHTGVRTTTFSQDVVDVPTMALWGASDIFDENVMFADLAEWVSDLRRERFPDASHWPHLERPERTNDVLRSFLAARIET